MTTWRVPKNSPAWRAAEAAELRLALARQLSELDARARVLTGPELDAAEEAEMWADFNHGPADAAGLDACLFMQGDG